MLKMTQLGKIHCAPHIVCDGCGERIISKPRASGNIHWDPESGDDLRYSHQSLQCCRAVDALYPSGLSSTMHINEFLGCLLKNQHIKGADATKAADALTAMSHRFM